MSTLIFVLAIIGSAIAIFFILRAQRIKEDRENSFPPLPMQKPFLSTKKAEGYENLAKFVSAVDTTAAMPIDATNESGDDLLKNLLLFEAVSEATSAPAHSSVSEPSHTSHSSDHSHGATGSFDSGGSSHSHSSHDSGSSGGDSYGGHHSSSTDSGGGFDGGSHGGHH